MKNRSVRWSLAVLLLAVPALHAADSKSSSVLDFLKGLLPTAQQEAVAAATPPVTSAAVLAVPAGSDLSPAFSDPGRVGLILDILSRVREGRPLPFPKDGVVFGNREARLPQQPSGFYREYTVLPPAGSPSEITVGDRRFRISPPQGHRGAERLVIGGGEVPWYTPDHYKTFIQLKVVR